ncbi:DegT/DnrJ/EryC1/StrS family aminotransferase [Streptomyces mirabilis]|uniref:DegT/DnrJ/EryC1/StrS family aminotransferase n=1 Tax=Streptomyces mirabilis TaxID=68239 RepID=UPI0036971030
MISLVSVDVHEAESLVLEVLRSGQLAQGPMVERLEKAIGQWAGVEHAVAVSSGTAAILLSLQAWELKPGDEVITSPFTFSATLNAIITSGATASFVDIHPDDFNIDPELLEARINDRTKVLLPVDLYGQTADMASIEKIAVKNRLKIVEDAAQAIGSSQFGRPAGSFGAGCFSLYATKNVTAGEGGVVTTDDGELADRIRLLRNQGMRDRYDYRRIGGNHRLSDLHAAVGLSQFAHLQEFSEKRAYNADRLSDGLAGIPGLLLPRTIPGRTHVWNQYTLRVTEDASCSRDELAAQLARNGIASGHFYPRPVFDYPCYRGHPQIVRAAVPVAARTAAEVLSLPVHPGLTDADLDRVIRETRAALRG